MGEQRIVYPGRGYAVVKDMASGKRRYYPVVHGSVVLDEEQRTMSEAVARAKEILKDLVKGEEVEHVEID